MKIETVKFTPNAFNPNRHFYDVIVNGDTLLECLSEEEVEELTVKEINQLLKIK